MNTQESIDHAFDEEAEIKDFERLIEWAREVGRNYRDEQIVDEIVHESRRQFKEMVSMLPFVGGKKSPFTDLMIQSGQTIAFYRACRKFDVTPREFGQLMYEIQEAAMQS
ncbi:MAG: hypothetical protein ACW992_10615, partial [Candidatus Thorarchaeota archaeon]